jgi:hypothetical protein
MKKLLAKLALLLALAPSPLLVAPAEAGSN